jgi:NTE family protein
LLPVTNLKFAYTHICCNHTTHDKRQEDSFRLSSCFAFEMQNFLIIFARMKRICLIIIAMLCLTQGIRAQKATGTKRQKIGLVLGGGGAKGAAHVGVLKELEKTGIKIDYIAGTSIGSIIGGLYSCGYRADDLEKLFMNENWVKLFASSAQGPAISIMLDSLLLQAPIMVENGWVLTSGKQPVVKQHQGMIPFCCVAADIHKHKAVILKDGDLVKSMRASMAIPGIFKPVRINNRRLIDGGAMNNLPVDVVRDMGADIVIAIDLTQNKHPDHEEKGIKTGIGMIDWIANRPDITLYNKNREDADIYINPDLQEFTAASFRPEDIKTMIERGREAGRKTFK